MKKFLLSLVIIAIPVFAYEVFYPDNYSYTSVSNKLLFVVDFSNSMSEYLESQTKVNQIKDLMNRILPQISSDTEIGLRVYGHTCNPIAFNACRSSELIVPLGFNNSNKIASELKHLRPRGMTPITYSLKQAVTKDFKGLDGDKHIILITDGGENCDESPCKYAMELVKYRKDIKIDVIAFNIDNDDDLDQLECVASVTKGKLYNADTKAKLIKSLNHAFRVKKEVDAKILY